MGTYGYSGTGTITKVTVGSSGGPAPGRYDIVAYGGGGGAAGYSSGGKGAEVGGYFSLSAGDVLEIVAAGAGKYGSLGGGGGGASEILVKRASGGGYVPLLVAGGGGGGGNTDGKNATGYGGSGAGGTTSTAPASNEGGGGGAGINGNGASAANRTTGGGGGFDTANGAGGGTGNSLGGGNGGFSGGGGGGRSGGGGGGYTGGNGGTFGEAGYGGSGGTSFIASTGTRIAAQTKVGTAAPNAGSGEVVLLRALSIALADDTGVSNTDRVTNNDALTGTAAPKATVTFAENGATIGTTMADVNGNYNFLPSNLPQGSQTVTASETVGGMTETASLAFTYDTTRPTITAVADSGPGIDAQGNGDLNAGKTVTLTVTTSEPVYVQGGTPALTLNDGGTATYAGGSGTNQITFSYTVASGQNTGQLAVSGVNANGAIVTDQAGNLINPSSLSSATTPSGTLVIDTTPPTASSPTTTAPQGAGPTPIGIAAPTDNETATGNLAITAGTLPGDGTVTLADGTTPVTAGESLTAQQLTGLEFTPRGAAGQSSAFTYSVTDGAGNAAQGTATLNVGAPGTSPTTTTTPTTDAVSISQEVGYYDGVFLLTGTAASPAGVSSVEISAVVNYGERKDLGAATVNPDGTFTFQDDIGAGDVQGFLQATETDGNRVQTVSADPLLSLEGPQAPDGQGPNATRYTAAGDQTAVTTFTDDGSQNVQVQGNGQTFASAYGDTFANNASLDTTFVFDPGYSLDTISGFQIGGAGHDTLSFLGSDFGKTPAAQLGRLLANASNDAGGLQIVDPTSKDVLQINGINKTQLVMNERDILFR